MKLAETLSKDWVCEVCGDKKTMTAKEAFNQGWDVPPWFTSGSIKCGGCPIDKTAWFILATGLKDS